jgi:hypothetical protein
MMHRVTMMQRFSLLISVEDWQMDDGVRTGTCEHSMKQKRCVLFTGVTKSVYKCNGSCKTTNLSEQASYAKLDCLQQAHTCHQQANRYVASELQLCLQEASELLLCLQGNFGLDGH